MKAGEWWNSRTGWRIGLHDLLSRHPNRRGLGSFLGSLTLLALLLVVVTGLALSMLYQPETAYQSLKNLEPFGQVVRGLHSFGTSLLIVLLVLHLLRGYLLAAYRFPREVQWLSGVLLLCLTLALAYSGSLLRGDDNAAWLTVIWAEQQARIPVLGNLLARMTLGGEGLNAATLPRLNVLHTLWLPLLLALLVGFHIYLALRNGPSEESASPAPLGGWRATLIGSLLVLLVTFLAWRYGAPPLGALPDPTNPNVHPRPDWYFAWYFALLALWPYTVASPMLFLAPALMVLVLLALPFLRPAGGRTLSRRPWAVGIALLVLAGMISLTWVGQREPWRPALDTPPLEKTLIGSSVPEVVSGADLFHDKSCLACHQIGDQGGQRGPNLSLVGDRLNPDQLVWRIQNGGAGMPSYAGILNTQDINDLVSFLSSRQSKERKP